MADLRHLSEEELLTACLWAEARGESEEGQWRSHLVNRSTQYRDAVADRTLHGSRHDPRSLGESQHHYPRRQCG